MPHTFHTDFFSGKAINDLAQEVGGRTGALTDGFSSLALFGRFLSNMHCSSSRKNNNIKTYQMKCNSGVAAVRNLGIAESKGKWIFFIDGDDILLPNALETMLAHVNDEYEVIMFDAVSFHNKEMMPQRLSTGRTCVLNTEKDIQSYLISSLESSSYLRNAFEKQYSIKKTERMYCVYAWGKLYRSAFLKDNSIFFDTRLRRAEDLQFYTSYALKMKNFCYSEECIYGYRINQKGITLRFSGHIIDEENALMKSIWETLKKAEN